MTETPVAGPIPRFELAEWRRLGIVAGVTGRGDDPARPFDLGLAGETTPVGRVMDHWRAFQESFPEFPGIVVSRQAHGTEIRWQAPANGLLVQYGADGHATRSTGLLLTVTVADCIPVYLADPANGVVALLHAGWRGITAGILGKALELLKANGSRVEKLLLHCGIGICGRCYEVGSEVLSRCGVPATGGGRGFVDLRALLVAQGEESGVVNISTSQLCTRHDQDRFFSHRGSGGQDGRQVAYLGMLQGV